MASSRSQGLSLAAAAIAAVVVAAFGGCGLSTQGTAERSGERCTTDAQCAHDNPCSVEACSADGVCTRAAAADGPAPAALQHPGSCQRTVCRAGAIATVADDANVSDDGEACTSDVCKDGKPTHPAKADATECKIGKATGRCVAGACAVECGQGLAACDDGDRCTDDACDVSAGACVFTPLDGVTIPGEKDAIGDCRTPRCVGGTEVAAAIDDTDLPEASSDCATPSCTNGAPATPPRATGTACATSGGRVCDGQGACVACNVEADCTDLPASDECGVRSCEAHACKLAFAAAGTIVTGQVVGDCTAKVCDGAGQVVTKADDADVPKDGNDCVDHLCDAGTPKTPPLPAGVSCGPTKAVCDGQGACIGCTAPGDCPGVDDACKKRTCGQQKCGFALQPAGKALPADQQAVGDCQELQCDDAGNVAAVVKQVDLPVDGNDCTEDKCTGGVASNPPAAADTACSTGVCDGAASCVACNDPAQCPAPPICVTATCVAHACATAAVAAGTVAPPAQQQAADCQDVVCDGKGAASQAPNPNDLPNDANQCTADTCSAAGTPTFAPLPAHAACTQGGGSVCDGKSSCVGCLDNSDCPPPNTCGAGAACTCVKKTCASLGLTCGSGSDGCGGTLQCNSAKKDGAETDVDCGGAAATCAARCGQGKACAQDGDCASAHCVDGVCCDKACAGPCEACTKAITGAASGTCADIPAGKVPDPNKPGCPNAGDLCGAGGLCRCADGAKDGTETDVDCGGGVCGGCPIALPCAKPTDCASGACADGICCGSACDAPCLACTKALTGGVDGTCGPVTPGTDPHAACALGPGGAELCGPGGSCQCADGAKDGAGGSAESDVDCGGSMCAKCAIGKSCKANTDCGSNVCADGVCCDGACGGPCRACTKALHGGADGTCGDLAAGQAPKSACPRPNDVCGVGGQCRCGDGAKDGAEADVDCGGAICGACSQGKTCGGGGDCASTFCVDAFCCDKACSGVCQSCAASTSNGANGACSDATPGLDPHQTCSQGGGSEVCGPGHKCQCADGAKDGAETDVDCGGGTCAACPNDKGCAQKTDCQSGFCGPDLLCHPTTCGDGLKDGTESDVDCGGASCPLCAAGKDCAVNSDCASNKCPGGKTCSP